MTQEEKHTLLVDLSARLPYGTKCTTKLTGYNDVYIVQGMYEDNVFIDCPVYEEGDDEWMIESIIPFLRPMSSMTDEEKEHLQSLHNIISDENYEDGYSPAAWDAISEFNDYCHAHHLDNRGLIGKGLALEASEQMYN